MRCCCPGRRERRQDRGWRRVRCGRGRVAWLPRQGSIKPVTPQALRARPFWARGAVWRRLHPTAESGVHAAAGGAGQGRRRWTTRRWWRRRPNSASGWPRPRGRAGAGPGPVTARVCPFGIPIPKRAERRAAGSAPMSRPRPRWVGGGLWLLLLVRSPRLDGQAVPPGCRSGPGNSVRCRRSTRDATAGPEITRRCLLRVLPSELTPGRWARFRRRRHKWLGRAGNKAVRNWKQVGNGIWESGGRWVMGLGGDWARGDKRNAPDFDTNWPNRGAFPRQGTSARRGGAD